VTSRWTWLVIRQSRESGSHTFLPAHPDSEVATVIRLRVETGRPVISPQNDAPEPVTPRRARRGTTTSRCNWIGRGNSLELAQQEDQSDRKERGNRGPRPIILIIRQKCTMTLFSCQTGMTTYEITYCNLDGNVSPTPARCGFRWIFISLYSKILLIHHLPT